jgi:tagaturonate reductase
LQVIISNTTEVGIQLVHDDIRKHPPVSYPGKLLSFLQERYNAFAGSKQSGFVIVPTELITDNGKKLESIVLELAHLNGMDEKFIEWVEKCNYFCNSLVDRIVPGKPDTVTKNKLEDKFGYEDDLLTMSEAYSLWAIEGDEHVKEILSFASADENIIITPDIEMYRELKLRLLNATHTLSCGVAFLAGVPTVKEATDNKQLNAFMEMLMLKEIATAIPYNVSEKKAAEFGRSVLERFANAQIQHYWHSITMNYTAKLKMRALPVLLKYYENYSAVPGCFATAFAAYLLFMKTNKQEAGIYYGNANGKEYAVNDEMAGYYYKLWLNNEPVALVNEVLQDTDLWGTNLASLPGFAAEVTDKLLLMMENGVLQTLQPKKVMA